MFDSNEELMTQIELGEDSVLEFKAMEFRGARIVGPDSRRIADEAAAMANVKGGVIVLGVEDATHAVVGIPMERLDQVETWARSLLFDSVQPPLAASIRRIRLPDARGRQVPCIRIDVPEGLTVHRSPNGYFQRIGSSKREFTPDELARQLTGTVPEYRVLSESELLLTIKALPEGSVEKFQQKARLIQQKTAEIHQKKVSVQQKTSDDSTEKSEMMMESILSLLRENPSISQKAVAAQLGTTRENIVYWFGKLKSKGRLIRRGPDKGGEWVVTK